MTRIGIMQGRLLPPRGERIQSFPTGAWADEFPLAASVPLQCIEWIYEVQGSEDNPLATDEGIERLRTLWRTHRVEVRSLCADYFMDRPFLRVAEADRVVIERQLVWLIQRCQKASIKRMVLPFVDASRIVAAEDLRLCVELLSRAMPILDRTDVEIHLETDLPPGRFAEMLAAARHPKIFVNYDSGNSASLGYHPRDEFAAYGDRIGSVHIKDRLHRGGTVPLGTGSVDFSSLFEELRRTGYDGDFILQVARGTPGDEVQWARNGRAFVERYLELCAVA
jgi:L-ribulose-5-phosphate 3-epimerase